jgi:isoleucyl-tRNA synthetase
MNKKAPYKKIITHGFVTDGKGIKMSKSIGNVIDPLEITKQMGSDVLRL